MSDQLPMFEPTTSEDTPSVTSLPELESGVTHSGSRDGQTTAKSGPDHVPASPLARPAKAKRSTTKGIFGQSGFHSSKHDDLSFALASKLRPLTDSLGSTLFSLTWTVRVTPAGRSISALRASDPLTEDSVYIGWPTAQARDWKSGSTGQETLEKNARPLSEQAVLGAWPTPMAGTPAQKGYNEAGNTDSGRKTVEMCQWPSDLSMDSGETQIGYLLGPNGWEIVPASGQLNAEHSRWLMGLPHVWDDCGVTAMASSRKRPKHS